MVLALILWPLFSGSLIAGPFFVAYLHEGVALRAILPEAIIYVFHGISDSELEYFKEYSLRPVVIHDKR
jgi:alanine racemase